MKTKRGLHSCFSSSAGANYITTEAGNDSQFSPAWTCRGYCQASRASDKKVVPKTALADSGIYIYWLRHILSGQKQSSGCFQGDGTGAPLLERTNRRHTGDIGFRLRPGQIFYGFNFGPEQPALLYADRIAADRFLQFRFCNCQQLSDAPGSLDNERAGAKHGMGSMRSLHKPLV